MLRKLAFAVLVAWPLTLLPQLLGASTAATGATATERTVAGGRLDWGVKASFQTYLTGPVAQGGWELLDGATTVGESGFRFHSASGDYDPDSGEVTAGYSGGVRFTGHQTETGEYQLDLTLSDPEVRISGDSGTLYADMRSRDRETGRISDATHVPLASLDLTGVDLRGGTQLAVSQIPATLTEDGAFAFAGFYEAGEQLDPVAFTADTRDPEPEPTEPSEPAETDDPDGDGSDGTVDGAFVDAAVDWGVRRTFREYVTGNVAAGEWRLSDGARDGGAVFRFPAGEGGLDLAAGTLDAAFAGSVRFTGTGLDLELSGVTVTVADGTGTLAADVSTAGGAPERDQPLVTFPAPAAELTSEDGLLLIEEAPAELTEAGAAAFAGLYQPGDAMDPVTLAVALDDAAELPALPDLGSEPTATVQPDARTDADPAAGEDPAGPADATDSGGSLDLPLIVTGAGAAAVLAVSAFLILRRTRSQNTEEITS
ncbi:HtaA domain-containing protein [Streptomyces sp. B6B3]|uniref:HtaA domain-containing protein n=1 Tax=Streptomyces sp. B6B3 TaxID=3153570 RepID=UPI00325C7628